MHNEQGFAIWEVRVADFEKNVTPHYFWYNLVKFCTIVKCYTISESWDVDYSSGAKKKFQIFLTNEKQALETWPSRVL